RLHRHPDQFSYNPLILAEDDRRHFAPPGGVDSRIADFTYERLENAHPSGGEAPLAACANRPSPENRGAGSPSYERRVSRSALIARTLCFRGGGGIRTHGSLAASAVFKTAAFDRSATPPIG